MGNARFGKLKDFKKGVNKMAKCDRRSNPKCGMQAPTLGLEKTPDEHIAKLVEALREFRRVLPDDNQKPRKRQRNRQGKRPGLNRTTQK